VARASDGFGSRSGLEFIPFEKRAALKTPKKSRYSSWIEFNLLPIT
jgi:hypothetical protein